MDPQCDTNFLESSCVFMFKEIFWWCICSLTSLTRTSKVDKTISILWKGVHFEGTGRQSQAGQDWTLSYGGPVGGGSSQSRISKTKVRYLRILETRLPYDLLCSLLGIRLLCRIINLASLLWTLDQEFVCARFFCS